MDPMSTFWFLLGLAIILWGFTGWMFALDERSMRHKLEREVYDDG